MAAEPGVVRLRALIDDDRARLLKWRNQPEIAAQMYTDHTITQAEHDVWFERACDDASDHLYRVVEAGPGPIGLISLTGIDVGTRTCTWGGYIGSLTWQGRGAGTAALWLSLGLAFGHLRLEQVRVEVLAHNGRAADMYSRFGFEERDDFHKVVVKSGQYCDVVGLALSRERWAATEPPLHRVLKQRGLIS
jgi:UDP-4-amino-4,6-dideoxy-N-acetyl-beta-L-altrosamine N-acetyltransferase